MFLFSRDSLEKLRGVHPALVVVASRALLYSPVDFRITEGMRTKERQAQLVKDGKSQTMNSRHLQGMALDFVALPGGKVSWDLPYYRQIADAFKKASQELGIPIVCGIDWKSFVDGPHIELDRAVYPDA